MYVCMYVYIRMQATVGDSKERLEMALDDMADLLQQCSELMH